MQIGNLFNFGTITEIHDNQTVNITPAGVMTENKTKEQDNSHAEAAHAEEVIPISEDAGELCPQKSTYENSPLLPFIADKTKAPGLLNWLHEQMDIQQQPKYKLMPLYAAVQYGYFISSIPHKIYEMEFGKMHQQTYSKWMSPTDAYDDQDIQNLLSSLKI